MNDYKNDTAAGESYKEISRIEFPAWAGWKEIDRHKTMYGFPDNLKFSNALIVFYKEWKETKKVSK